MRQKFIEYLRSLPSTACNQICHPTLGHVQSFLSTSLGGGDVTLSQDLTSFTHNGVSRPLDPELASCVCLLDQAGSERGEPVEDDFITICNKAALDRLDPPIRHHFANDRSSEFSNSRPGPSPSLFRRAVNLLGGSTSRFSELDLSDPSKIPPPDFHLSTVSWNIARPQLLNSRTGAFFLFQKNRILIFCRRTSWEPAGWCTLGDPSNFGFPLEFPSLDEAKRFKSPHPLTRLQRSRFNEWSNENPLQILLRQPVENEEYGFIAVDASSPLRQALGGPSQFFMPYARTCSLVRGNPTSLIVTWVSLV